MKYGQIFSDLDYFKVHIREYDESKDFYVTRPASLNNPKDHSVMFIQKSFMKYVDSFYKVRECLVFWPEEITVPDEIDHRHVVVLCENSHLAFCQFFKEHNITNFTGLSEVREVEHYFVTDGIKIGKGTKVFPYVYMNGNISIGDNCYIGAGARIIGNVFIGDNVVIKENTVIGADSLTTGRDEEGAAVSMPQFGGVVIEDNVQIGANTTIARGAIDNTVISKGCKIDNSVYIAHNNLLGENVFVVGESLTFGSVTIGKNTLVSGNAAIRNGITVGEGCLIGSGAMVTRNVKDGKVVMGNPAKEIYFPRR